MGDQASIKIGILGLGGIGDTHARALAALARSGTAVEVVTFSGGSAEQMARAGWADARRLDAAELITDRGPDLIAICTPSALHAGQAATALRAGKHVVVEKPMALSVEDARELRDLAADRQLLISPIAQRRFEPLNVELKELIDSGRLGRVVLGETFVHWFRSDAYYAEVPWRGEPMGGGGSLMNQGLHNVDLLCWLLGDVRTVTGATATLGHRIAVEDTAVGCLQFAGGALGVVATTTATPPGVPSELAIWTTTGSVR
ncbi:MAG TPA: Gfo/Idh/MocA family oxidoreductase, partial [Microlunatus sp.]